MSDALYSSKPLYPLFVVAASILVIVFGLAFAPETKCFYFLGAAWILFFVFGCWRACLAVIPPALLFGAIFALLTYSISKNVNYAFAAFARVGSVFLAAVPGLSVPPVNLVRAFSSIRVKKSHRPFLRAATLGMMITLSFFPLLNGEVRQVREAMMTRGAGSVLNPKIFYRAFLIPLVIRLVNISDTLSLSLETRGFSLDESEHSVYKEIKIGVRDAAFIFLMVLLCAFLVSAVCHE